MNRLVNRTVLSTVAVAAAFVFGTVAAHADATFCFPGRGGQKYFYDFESPDLDVRVTATHDHKPTKVYQGPLGLGIKTSWLDPYQVDGFGKKEILWFDFSEAKTMLTSAKFVFTDILGKTNSVEILNADKQVVATIDLNNGFDLIGYKTVDLTSYDHLLEEVGS